MSFLRPVFNRTADFPAYRSSKYRFCFPGDSNTIAESTQLGNYILSTPKVRIFRSFPKRYNDTNHSLQNVAALKQSDEDQTVASLFLSYRANAASRPDQQTGLQSRGVCVFHRTFN